MRALAFVVAVLASTPSVAESSFLHTPLTEAPAGTPLVIEGSLVTGSFSRLVLRFRAGAAWDEAPLELQYGDLYRGTIPPERVKGSLVEYFVEGVRSSGERVSLLGTNARPLRVKVIGGQSEEETTSADATPAVPARCKKLKKGRKVPKECEEFVFKKEPEAPPAEPEASDGVVAPSRHDDSKEPRRNDTRADETRFDEPRREEPRREEPTRQEEAASRQAEPKRNVPRRSELDEELAVYGAEATAGLVQRVDDAQRSQPIAPSVLTQADLRRLGVRSVHEALDFVPGLSVSRDVQGFYRLAVRGLRSDPEVLVLLNGQRLNNFYDGKALASLPIDTIERIEVIRGPATADLGFGDVQAVISLITNKEEGLRASASGGLYSAFDGHLSAAKRLGSFLIHADGDVASQQGYRRDVPTDGLSSLLSRSKSTLDRRFLVNAGAGVSYANDTLGELSASGRFMLENRSALLGLFDVVGNDSSLQWQTIQASVGWVKPVADHKVSLRLWFDQQNTDRLWQLTPDGFQARASDPATRYPDGLLQQVLIGTRGLGLVARGEFSLPAKNHLVATLSAEWQTLSSYAQLSNQVVATNAYAGALVRPDGLLYPTEKTANSGERGPAADRLGLGASLSDTWSLVDAVAIQAGVRFDVTQLPTAADGAWTGATFVPSVGPRVGLVVTPVPALRLRGHYGRSFRTPTVQELADTAPNTDANQGRAIGNPSLQGSYFDSVEAGFEYVQAVGDGKLRLSGTAFFFNQSNTITNLDTSGNLVPYSNRPLGVHAFGAEGEARLEVTRRASVWVNASWVRAEDLGTPTTARLLTEVPQARLNAGISLPLGPYFAFDVVSRYGSERRNNSRSVLELVRRYSLPAYTVINAQLRTELLFDHLELAVIGQNVFNLEYSDDATRPDRVPQGVPRETVLVFGSARVVF